MILEDILGGRGSSTDTVKVQVPLDVSRGDNLTEGLSLLQDVQVLNTFNSSYADSSDGQVRFTIGDIEYTAIWDYSSANLRLQTPFGTSTVSGADTGSSDGITSLRVEVINDSEFYIIAKEYTVGNLIVGKCNVDPLTGELLSSYSVKVTTESGEFDTLRSTVEVMGEYVLTYSTINNADAYIKIYKDTGSSLNSIYSQYIAPSSIIYPRCVASPLVNRFHLIANTTENTDAQYITDYTIDTTNDTVSVSRGTKLNSNIQKTGVLVLYKNKPVDISFKQDAGTENLSGIYVDGVLKHNAKDFVVHPDYGKLLKINSEYTAYSHFSHVGNKIVFSWYLRGDFETATSQYIYPVYEYDLESDSVTLISPNNITQYYYLSRQYVRQADAYLGLIFRGGSAQISSTMTYQDNFSPYELKANPLLTAITSAIADSEAECTAMSRDRFIITEAENTLGDSTLDGIFVLGTNTLLKG